MEIKYPQLAADHDREVHVSNPTWRDVPEVQTVSQKEVREIVIETIEGVFNNGATKRCEVIYSPTEILIHSRRIDLFHR